MNDRTDLPLEFGPSESIFVVFDPDAAGAHFECVARDGQSQWPHDAAPLADFPKVWMQADGKIVMESSLPGGYVIAS